MSKTKQDRSLSAQIATVIGMLIAVTAWVLLVLWMVNYFGFQSGDSIEDVIGIRSPFLISLITIPNALLVAFAGVAIGKAIQSVFNKNVD